jgi:hypothetical protein
MKETTFNIATGEVIENDLSEAEFTESMEAHNALEQMQAERDAIRESALAKLAALGLTQDEINAL